jgi:cell division protein FtsB
VRFFGPLQKKYLFLLGLFISGMLLFAVFGSRGLVQIYRLKEERDQIQTANLRLQEDNRKLGEQISRLRNNKDEVEKIAREERGMVKKGELVYEFEK